MRTDAPWAVPVLALLLAVAGGCPEGDPTPPGPDADADSDVDADADGEPDGDAPPDASPDGSDGDAASDADGVDSGFTFDGAGPLTFLADEYRLTAELLCDVDGDGRLDNSIRQLGDGAAEMAVAAFSSGILPREDPDTRLLVHLPWVDDRSGPDEAGSAMLLLRGIDTDEPRDPTDDFSTVETFWAIGRLLDGCGEPLFSFRDVALDGGAFAATDGEAYMFVYSVVKLRHAQASGTISPGGARIAMWICGAAPIHDLGLAPSPTDSSPDVSMLDAFVAGSAAFGIPGIPGLTPDIDLDGDGLESFEVDDLGAIARCVDGDRVTVIEGPGCWEDPRMADAFSLSLRYEGVPAAFAGRQPGWQHSAEGTCDAPPETSLFDP